MIPEKRVEAIRGYTKPLTKKGLRDFLGVASFYRRYVEKLAEETAMLSPATSKAAPSRIIWIGGGIWREPSCLFVNQCQIVFILCVPLPEHVFSIVTDASMKGIGGVL